MDLKATVSPSDTAGSVEFFDTVGGTPTSLGTSAVSAGVATKSVSPAAGDHSYSAKFTPADASVTGSTSSSLPFTIKAPATATTVSLSASNTNPDAGSPVDLTAATGPAGVAGSVEFIDSVSGSLGTVPAPNGSGQYVLSTSALASGSHSVTAKFTPASDTYAISNSAPVAINVKAAACPTGSVCTDDQAFQVTVDAGTIVIATPYTPANPFDLGSMKAVGGRQAAVGQQGLRLGHRPGQGRHRHRHPRR
ncbi:hypothetical protein GCM10025868_19440 [Angustibacter aerolatus]|uniref:Bacterial Ig-like domain-containing protein n=1 Tax=Angustibacter aerolatus TaxID=1162965 RepID=A0ABQ6JH43_9ACTN|nr:Ig-like domain-containing protein [Angustibacter aerolatus]GMA86694.1 hypothetical protein GCM10025868_19440 [Angustibacter aerolatus]